MKAEHQSNTGYGTYTETEKSEDLIVDSIVEGTLRHTKKQWMNGRRKKDKDEKKERRA